jgi:uncharacterized protein YbcC (UPF0753/DUF2309 family)
LRQNKTLLFTKKQTIMTLNTTTQQQTITGAKPPLSEQLAELYRLIAPTWPLAHAVACNPLQGLEELPFEEATRKGQELFDAQTLPGFWQLRQALAAGHITQEQVEQSIDNALEGLPAAHAIAKDSIALRPLMKTMVEELDERYTPSHTPELLQQALGQLQEANAWQGTLEPVNKDTITWLSAFLDEGQAAWPMPMRERGFYRAVKALMELQGEGAGLLELLPEDSEEAIALLLDKLPVAPKDHHRFLRDQLLALPGWASFIRWRSGQSDYAPQLQYPITLNDYLAVRLLLLCQLPQAAWEEAVVPQCEWLTLHHWAAQQLRPEPATDPRAWADLLQDMQEACHRLRLSLLQSWEAAFRQHIGRQLQQQMAAKPETARPDAQLAFCIDVRSEPFRRQVEACGDYETFGFAGFFGLPIAYETVLGKRVKSLPVLLQPAHELREQASPCCAHQAERHQNGLKLLKELKQAYKSLKYNIATPFAAVEALGLPAGLITVGRSIIPQPLSKLRRLGRRWFRPEIDTAPDINPAEDWGIPFDNQVAYAGNALRMMGLTRNFAPLVVLCGHGSQTENNPYAAALDCGACGGSHGGPNAAAMARILNQEAVRDALREEGIAIPQDTLFVGAEHNTTTDAVRLIDLPSLTEEKQAQAAHLKSNLERAQKRNLAERAGQFGLKTSKGMLRRSTDWSEVRPEWGLAGNAGFVVAPRQLTEKLDLRGRCFLHSYDWEQDAEATSLEVILTAPLVVAQWINSQYFFSTVDNTAFGSGSKVTHNVVGKIGVMQGNSSDLMHGLPWQSVMKNDEELYHEPLRLTAFVVAPKERVQMLVEKHEVLQKLLYNEWVAMQVLDPETEQLWALGADGKWVAAIV